MKTNKNPIPRYEVKDKEGNKTVHFLLKFNKIRLGEFSSATEKQIEDGDDKAICLNYVPKGKKEINGYWIEIKLTRRLYDFLRDVVTGCYTPEREETLMGGIKIQTDILEGISYPQNK